MEELAQNELMIYETSYWTILHRSDSMYLGYLMVSSLETVSDVCGLSSDSLRELGKVLQITEKLLISVYSPHKVIMTKLGFSKGFSCHFHVLPVSHSLLNQVTEHSHYTNNEPDGVDALSFINREYCDKRLTQRQYEDMVREVIMLREQYKKLFGLL